MIKGRLKYYQENDRYLVVNDVSGEELAELHCGNGLSVLTPEGWTDTRIEYGINMDAMVSIHRDEQGRGHFTVIGGLATEKWYLAGTPLTGWQLDGLFVRCGA